MDFKIGQNQNFRGLYRYILALVIDECCVPQFLNLVVKAELETLLLRQVDLQLFSR